MTLKVPSNPTQSDPHHEGRLQSTQLSGIKEKEANPGSYHGIPKRNRGRDAQGGQETRAAQRTVAIRAPRTIFFSAGEQRASHHHAMPSGLGQLLHTTSAELWVPALLLAALQAPAQPLGCTESIAVPKASPLLRHSHL